MTVRGKPTLCVDFDGVIHSYESGWQGGEIYGHVVPGFLTWLLQTREFFTISVYSARSRDEQMRMEMAAWFRRQMAERFMPEEIEDIMSSISFVHEKPKAWLTIDDRCIRFDGNWEAPELTVTQLLAYKPWTDLPR